MSPKRVSSVDPLLYTLVAKDGIGHDLFNAVQHKTNELIELYVADKTYLVLKQLGVWEKLAQWQTVDELVGRCQFVPAFAPPLRLLLEILEGAALVRVDVSGENPAYRRTTPTPTCAPSAIRAESEQPDISFSATLVLIDHCAAIYPRLARGEVLGNEALLTRVDLWRAYFDNHNAGYALCNRLASRVAGQLLPRKGGSVLEVGAGFGSGTLALLEEFARVGCVERLKSFRVTEPVGFLRREAKRRLRARYPGLALEFAPLDLNEDWNDLSSQYSVVYGVNVFHLAQDLRISLRRAWRAIEPSGWLVLGECVRPFHDKPVGIEFCFHLLRSYTNVNYAAGGRTRPGFLTPEEWLSCLGRAGFEDARVVPDVARLRELHPRFCVGVVCGRRPAM